MFIESSHFFRMRWTRILKGLACHLHCERLAAIRIQFTCFVAHKSAILTTAKTGRGFLRHVMLIAIGRTVLRLLYTHASVWHTVVIPGPERPVCGFLQQHAIFPN
jgi:hypothetical protein